MYAYINASRIKKLVKENKKRCSKDFLTMLDKYIEERVVSACNKIFNGHKKTLNGSLLKF